MMILEESGVLAEVCRFLVASRVESGFVVVAADKEEREILVGMLRLQSFDSRFGRERKGRKLVRFCELARLRSTEHFALSVAEVRPLSLSLSISGRYCTLAIEGL